MNSTAVHCQWNFTFTISQCIRIDLQCHTVLLGYQGAPDAEGMLQAGQNFIEWLSTTSYKSLLGAGILLPIDLALQDSWYATKLKRISIISNDPPESEYRVVGLNQVRIETFASGHIREFGTNQTTVLQIPIVAISCNLNDASNSKAESLPSE